MKGLSLMEALEELQERYTLEHQLTYDSLEGASISARLKLVRDLIELLSPVNERTKGQTNE